MPQPIVDDLIDMFPDVLLRRTVTTNAFGSPLTVGAWEPIPAHVSQNSDEIKGADGKLVKSSVKAILAGMFGASVRDEFRLPSRFTPRDVRALNVYHGTDENGAHHETVYF